MERKIKSLSWSKINSFENFRPQFIKSYFEEEPFFENKELLFWKIMSAILELNVFDFDEIINHLSKDRKWKKIELESWKIDILQKSYENISRNEEFCEKLMNWQFDLFPKYEEYLQEFIKVKPIDWIFDIYCLWYLDNSNSDLSEFREFKTGKAEWTQNRADNHWQFYFYAMLIEAKTGKLPKKAYLDWIQTEDDEDWKTIKPTWVIKTFEVEIKKEKVEELKNKLPIIFADIQKEYEKWINSQEWSLSISSEKVEKYAELERTKKEIEEKQKNLKKEIDEDMQKNKVDNFKLEWVWTFFYTARRKWDYSEEIKNKESEIEEEMKEKMKEVIEMKADFESKNEPEISLSLAFRLWK